MNNNPFFTPLEETISFYTRNDFAIINHLLIGNYDGLWKYALIAYNDNRGILDEYAQGLRTVNSDYDIKWINCLQKRLLPALDDTAKEIVIRNANRDIANILNAMRPANKPMQLYRTAWIDNQYAGENTFAYSREYRSLQFGMDSVLEIKTITSCSLTPYRETDDVGSNFYRYEIHVPCGLPVLELDQFVTHNEDGEVLLPPMKCRVIGIRSTDIMRCKGIVDLAYSGSLSVF